MGCDGALNFKVDGVVLELDFRLGRLHQQRDVTEFEVEGPLVGIGLVLSIALFSDKTAFNTRLDEHDV